MCPLNDSVFKGLIYNICAFSHCISQIIPVDMSAEIKEAFYLYVNSTLADGGYMLLNAM